MNIFYPNGIRYPAGSSRSSVPFFGSGVEATCLCEWDIVYFGPNHLSWTHRGKAAPLTVTMSTNDDLLHPPGQEHDGVSTWTSTERSRAWTITLARCELFYVCESFNLDRPFWTNPPCLFRLRTKQGWASCKLGRSDSVLRHLDALWLYRVWSLSSNFIIKG